MTASHPAALRRWRAARSTRAGIHVVPVVLVACAVALFYDRGVPNYDLAYALSWGAQLASGHAPSYGVPLPPTPHPLTNLLGVLLSPLGGVANDAAALLGLLAFATLAYLAFLVGRELAGTVAGVVAALLVLTRSRLVFWSGLDYLDIPYCALVLAAILIELRGGERRARGVLGVLGLAGLLRPEAWLLSGAYVGLAWWRGGRRLPPLELLVLAAAAPLLWVAMDFVTTGRPLYSFTLTRDLTQEFGRQTGPGAVAFGVPRSVGQAARPAVALAAGVGLALLLQRNRGPALKVLAMATMALGASALVIAAGTPLNDRYVFLGPVVACVFAGAAVAELFSARSVGRVAAGLAAVALLIGFAVDDVPQLRRARADLALQRAIVSELHGAVDAARHSRCERIVAQSRLAPYLSVWTGAPAPRFLIHGREMPAAAVISPTSDQQARAFAGSNSDALPPGNWSKEPPAFRGRFWTLRLACQ